MTVTVNHITVYIIKINEKVSPIDTPYPGFFLPQHALTNGLQLDSELPFIHA